jgi:hypothetical protein
MPFDLVVADQPVMMPPGRHRFALAFHGGLRFATGDGEWHVIEEGCAVVWSPDEPAASVDSAGTAIVVTGEASGQLPG